jgi:hypothetical protein
MNRQPIQAGRRRHRDLRRSNATAGLEQLGPRPHVLPASPDMSAGPGGNGYETRILYRLAGAKAGLVRCVLDSNNGIDGRRHARAGRDPDCTSRRDEYVGRAAGPDLAHDPESDRRIRRGSGNIGSMNREAIHGAVVPGRQISGASDGRCEYSP